MHVGMQVKGLKMQIHSLPPTLPFAFPPLSNRGIYRWNIMVERRLTTNDILEVPNLAAIGSTPDNR